MFNQSERLFGGKKKKWTSDGFQCKTFQRVRVKPMDLQEMEKLTCKKEEFVMCVLQKVV